MKIEQALKILTDVQEGCKAWVLEARVIGDVKAGDIFLAIQAIKLEHQPKTMDLPQRPWIDGKDMES